MGIVGRFVRTWIVGRLLKRNPIVLVLLWLVNRVRRGLRTAREVPLSTLRARGRVGANFLERRGLVDDRAPPPNGEIDDLDAFARSSGGPSDEDDGFDPASVDERVRDFSERTAAYRLAYRVRWGRGFRLGARLAARVTSRIEQLNLPGRSVGWRRLHSRFVAVDLPDDPRDDVRGWVRTDDDGDCVFLALYGSHTHDTDGHGSAERFVNIAVPLPGCTLSTVLRPRNVGPSEMDSAERSRLGRVIRPVSRFTARLDRFASGPVSRDGAESESVGDGIEWTTAGGGHPGLYLRLPGTAYRLPIGQRFLVAPAGPDDSAKLRAVHEMRVVGVRFLRIDYRMER